MIFGRPVSFGMREQQRGAWGNAWEAKRYCHGRETGAWGFKPLQGFAAY